MTCHRCSCPAGSARVVLETNEEVSSYCPRWLEETGTRQRDCNAMLKLPDKQARREYLSRVRFARGDEAARRLEALVRLEWAKRYGVAA